MIPRPFFPATGMGICACLHYLLQTQAGLPTGESFPLLRIGPCRGATLSLLSRGHRLLALWFTLGEGNHGPGAIKWHTSQRLLSLRPSCHSPSSLSLFLLPTLCSSPFFLLSLFLSAHSASQWHQS